MVYEIIVGGERFYMIFAGGVLSGMASGICERGFEGYSAMVMRGIYYGI